jgi:hypothetical protein
MSDYELKLEMKNTGYRGSAAFNMHTIYSSFPHNSENYCSALTTSKQTIKNMTGVELIHAYHDSDQWCALVDTVINLPVS